MIRTSTTSTSHSRDRALDHDWRKGDYAPPHQSGVLERAGSTTSTYTDVGWDIGRRRRSAERYEGNEEMGSCIRVLGGPLGRHDKRAQRVSSARRNEVREKTRGGSMYRGLCTKERA